MMLTHVCPKCGREHEMECTPEPDQLCPVCDVNEELCAKCGGECCKIFLHCPESSDFADHVDGWGKVLGKVPKEYSRMYDLKDYYDGKSIPVECPYLGIGGCLINKRDDRPRVCLEYKCGKWKKKEE